MAALHELAQKVRDGTDLVLLCAGRIESCHGDLLRKGILAEAAQLEATSKRKPRSDKGKPRGPRGPRADSVETAARMGVLSTFYLRHAYGRDSPGLHEGERGALLEWGGAVRKKYRVFCRFSRFSRKNALGLALVSVRQVVSHTTF